MRRTSPRRAVLVAAACLGALLALAASAGAVLPGTNGRIVFASGRDEASDATAKLYLRTAFGGVAAGSAGLTVTPTGAIQHRHPTWSPDRTRIAYAAGPGTNFDIFILDLTSPGAIPQNITNSNNVTDDRPAWSPDGTRIAFDSENADGSNQLNIKMYDVGTGITTDFTSITAGTFEHKPAWTPDSQTLFYGTGDLGAAGAMDVVRQPADGSAAASNVAAAPGISEFQPSVSPDGTEICFTRGDFGSGTARVVVSLANGGGQMVLPGNNAAALAGYNCTWSPDGTKIAYVQGVFTTGDLAIENSDLSGQLLFLETTMGRFDGNPDWAPDGRPTCEDATVNTAFNTPVSIPLSCADTGPGYERSEVIVDVPADGEPANGTAGEVQQGDPATVTYTPNAGFSGTDSFEARVRDAIAFSVERGTVTVNVAGPPPNGNGGGPDVTASNITGVRVAPRRWRRGSGLPAGSAAPVGTRIRWRLSEAARVTLTFQRARPGRRVGRRCLPSTRQRRSRPPCLRFRRAGRIVVPSAQAGLNTLRFQGRLTRRRRLGLGVHRVVVGAVDAAGNRSASRRSRTFRIVAR